ncbi:MAG: FAD-dependent oxidoreductase [Opitutales bacterium]
MPESPNPFPNLTYFHPAPDDDRRTLEVDLCVYGGTASGVIAAIQGADSGLNTLLVGPDKRLGGMTTGGLSLSDVGNRSAVGGLSRAFYRELGKRYDTDEEWNFEPKQAVEILESWLADREVPVVRQTYLDAVDVSENRIQAVRFLTGLTVKAGMFIDATYEGDLMARAGVPFAIGRESNEDTGETLNGMQWCYEGSPHHHKFDNPVDPWVIPGVPSSGPLPGVDPAVREERGRGDHRVQAYNFRLILTQEADNRIAWPKPPGYSPNEYELLRRIIETGWDCYDRKYDPIRGKKVDKNNNGPFSTDFIGRNWAWPNGDYATRERLFQEHVSYTAGFFWYCANDPSVPDDIRDFHRSWGLCRDEFTETGGWSHQLYIREGRRMVSDFVITENHVLGKLPVEDPVGLGAYGMDSHNCSRFITSEGHVQNEGDVQVHGFDPYGISFRSLLPPPGSVENLVVSCAVSASHIAFGSLRMEPVFMVLGQSAALIAELALKEKASPRQVGSGPVAERLAAADQVLGGVNAVKNTQLGI